MVELFWEIFPSVVILPLAGFFLLRAIREHRRMQEHLARMREASADIVFTSRISELSNVTFLQAAERMSRASERSRDLFIKVAGIDAYETLKDGRPITIRGSLGGEYRLWPRSVYNIERVSDGAQLCAVPVNAPELPVFDVVLATKLTVENDEERFLQVARRREEATAPIGVSMDAVHENLIRNDNIRPGVILWAEDTTTPSSAGTGTDEEATIALREVADNTAAAIAADPAEAAFQWLVEVYRIPRFVVNFIRNMKVALEVGQFGLGPGQTTRRLNAEERLERLRRHINQVEVIRNQVTAMDGRWQEHLQEALIFGSSTVRVDPAAPGDMTIVQTRREEDGNRNEGQTNGGQA